MYAQAADNIYIKHKHGYRNGKEKKNEIETVYEEKERETKKSAVTHSNNNAIGINRFGTVISRVHTKNTQNVCGEWIMEKDFVFTK